MIKKFLGELFRIWYCKSDFGVILELESYFFFLLIGLKFIKKIVKKLKFWRKRSFGMMSYVVFNIVMEFCVELFMNCLFEESKIFKLDKIMYFL